MLQSVDNERPLYTSQVLAMMMSLVAAINWMLMYFLDVPEAPLGRNDIWPHLTVRGVAGAFGIWGFYYSLRYLPVSEATILNFLSPMVAACSSSLLNNVPFTLGQQLASLISILGAVLVSQPWQYSIRSPPGGLGEGMSRDGACQNCTAHGQLSSGFSFSSERSTAIWAALVGVAGGSAAFVAMAAIGKRAHPTVTVNHFAVWTVILTSLDLACLGTETLRPPTLTECGLLVFMGIFGLLLHLLIAASLRDRDSNRALSIVYIQIAFTLLLDKLVWDLSPSWVSLLGGILIVGSAITVAATGDQMTIDKSFRDVN
ncbi:hypothetical protein MGYG_03205 [Nannizzia gypsea CBS 118893]|uniref:EamA domain-containing protein n=1 Tax=Arthroderma gypseum (strain ATCC MYA-4604 / CBS 118893) TaxID=535722 RepID=E4URD9_ARTGP|nr:hypothetical protein MGYG_03205 [Nannizzia gypsea CBS 118893]EFR00202.1 hypothetical protein MGYG_03205 [Nannizzia gypsea CBS 118893]